MIIYMRNQTKVAFYTKPVFALCLSKTILVAVPKEIEVHGTVPPVLECLIGSQEVFEHLPK